ncbi:MAG: hypothetical protein ACKVVP_12410 [Chloroflexota bacterium]
MLSVPGRTDATKDASLYQCEAILVRRRQEVLIGDGQALLTSTRGRAGTIELISDALKNVLAARVYPSN